MTKLCPAICYENKIFPIDNSSGRNYILRMKYSNRLRVVRAEKRISQIDAAAKARVSINRWWRIENGYNDATPEERQRIAQALGVDVEIAFPSEAVA